MWHDQSTNRINLEEDIKCTSFYDTQEKMIKHVTDFKDMELEKLEGMDERISGIFGLSKDMDLGRIEKIKEGFNYRKNRLERIIEEYNKK